MYFFPIFNKTPLKFPISWVWVMFPKYWEKTLVREISVYKVDKLLNIRVSLHCLEALLVKIINSHKIIISHENIFPNEWKVMHLTQCAKESLFLFSEIRMMRGGGHNVPERAEGYSLNLNISITMMAFILIKNKPVIFCFDLKNIFLSLYYI